MTFFSLHLVATGGALGALAGTVQTFGLTPGGESDTLKLAAVLRRGGGGSLNPKSARRGADIPFEG